EDLVDQQDVGVDVNGDGEAEAHVHARRVRFHRRVDELAELGEVDDLVEALLNLPLGQAEHDAVDEHVLAAGDLGVEAGAELDERRNSPGDADRSAGRLGDAGDELQRGALAGAVAAHYAVSRAFRYRHGDIGKGREGFAR